MMSEQLHQPSRLAVGLVAMTAVLAIVLFVMLELDTIGTIQIHGTLYQDIIQGKNLQIDVFPTPASLTESYFITLRLLSPVSAVEREVLVKRFFELEDQFLSLRARWQHTLSDSPMKETFIYRSAEPALKFFAMWHHDFLPAIQRGDSRIASQTAHGPLKDHFESHQLKLRQLVELIDAHNRNTEERADDLLAFRVRLLAAMGFSLIVLVFAAAWFINRHMTAGLIAGIKAQERHTQAIMDTALDAIIITDTDGLIIEWNTRAEENFGWSCAEVLHRPIVEVIVPPQYRYLWLDHFREFVLRPASSCRFEISATHRNGTEFYAEVAITPVTQSAKPTFSTFVRDITERKNSKAILAETAARLHLAQVSAGIGVWEYSIGDKRLIWDSQMIAIYEYTQGTFPGSYSAWSERLHPEDKPAAEQAVQSAIQGGPPFDTEFRLLLPDGSTRHIKAHAVVLKDDGGVPVRMIGINYDITAQKLANAAVRDQETRLRAIVDHAVDGIITIDERGTIESFNPAAERLFGHTAAEIIGQNVKRLMPEPYQSEHDGYLARYHQTGEKRIIGIGREVVGRRKDGSTFPLELAVSEMHLGDRRRFTGIVRDVTERKLAEHRLEQAALEMECRSLELEDAHEQALAATKAKSEFLASMSHEIRTPMNAIVAMADMLRETPLSKEQQEYVGRFSRAAESLLDLINDILDLSKIEAGHLELESIAFDIHDLIDKTAELMAVRAQAKRLELTAFVHPEITPWRKGDPTRLRQILVNLVGNAIKFTERGEVSIRVEPDAEDPNTLRCSVADTGIGIPEEKIDSIFDSFTQVDSSTTRKYGGTGLGLSICKRLVELMGGTITLSSMPGLGSTFTFDVALPSEPAPANTSPSPVLALQGRRLLVVDDTEANRTIIREYLTRFEPLLVEASDGIAALAALDLAHQRTQPFDLVILDSHMPGMDGVTLGRAIRERGECRSLPLILLAAQMGGADFQQATDLGKVSILHKPISHQRLLESLAMAFSAEPAAPQPVDSAPAVPAPSGVAPLRILLTDDVEDNRDVVKLFLKDLPYTIDEAENGSIALQKFQASAYDLVFMDIQMPVMDGYQATMAIRQWEQERQRTPTPILALTANAFKDELDKALAAGCVAHVTKPIKKKTLLAAIAQYTKPPDELAA